VIHPAACPWCGLHPEERRRDLRRSPVREDCACGLAIVAQSRLPEDVVDAVRRHQVEPVHLAWREREGL
jgi:hypothetical protein